jgi:hypothetical protein
VQELASLDRGLADVAPLLGGGDRCLDAVGQQCCVDLADDLHAGVDGLQDDGPVQEFGRQQLGGVLSDGRSDSGPPAAQGAGVGAHFQMPYDRSDVLSAGWRHAFYPALFEEEAGLLDDSWPRPSRVQFSGAQDVLLQIAARDQELLLLAFGKVGDLHLQEGGGGYLVMGLLRTL